MTRQEIVVAVMEKKNKKSSINKTNGSNANNDHTGPNQQHSSSFRTTNSTCKTGFLDGEEVLNASKNVSTNNIDQVKIQLARQMLTEDTQDNEAMTKTRFWGDGSFGSSRTTQCPVLEMNDLELQDLHKKANTENISQVSLYSATSANNRSFQWLNDDNDSNDSGNKENNTQANLEQSSSSFLSLESKKASMSERYLVDSNDINLDYKYDKEKIMFRTISEGFKADDTPPISPSFKNDLLQNKNDNVNSKSIIQKGFKIGEKCGYEEYVHRETGESFWVDTATGDVLASLPDQI